VLQTSDGTGEKGQVPARVFPFASDEDAAVIRNVLAAVPRYPEPVQAWTRAWGEVGPEVDMVNREFGAVEVRVDDHQVTVGVPGRAESSVMWFEEVSEATLVSVLQREGFPVVR
jgi:hypothetical protein